ncbi:MAG: hypothetical protein SGPRY_013922, partial [Prymnesium sp.]
MYPLAPTLTNCLDRSPPPPLQAVGRLLLQLSRLWADDSEEVDWHPVRELSALSIRPASYGLLTTLSCVYSVGAGQGVELLIRLKCWLPAQLGKAHSQERLFSQYS